jgi:hypothetical protein
MCVVLVVRELENPSTSETNITGKEANARGCNNESGRRYSL